MSGQPVVDGTTDTLDALDFPTPCSALGDRWHPVHGTGPAVWAVVLVPCCRPKAGPMCDGCLQHMLTYPGGMECNDCGRLHKPSRHGVLSIEPLT